MIASDLNNPEFVGAINPDSRLAAQFYSKPVQNEFKTLTEGRPIFEDVTFVKIFTPGNNLNIIDTPAREDHKERFPLQWAHFQNKHGGDAREIGTPLSHWPLITAAQAEELKALKFFTVESVANASDAQLQRIGMLAGMSQYAFKERAQQFLRSAQGESAINAAEEKVKKLEEENARIQAETAQKLAEMQAQISALVSAGTKGKPGRKPRSQEE